MNLVVRRSLTWAWATAPLALSFALAACGGGGEGSHAPSGSSSSTTQGMSAVAQLGERIFNDTRLSLNGNQSCASCHDAAHAHGAPNDLAVQLGSDAARSGNRVSPSIRYLRFNGAFHLDEGTPTGGFFWDGRAASLADQAKQPFLNPNEMANADEADVIRKLQGAPYAQAFAAQFGAHIFDDPHKAFERVALALQAFQQESPELAPFTSKYDAYLRGEATLSQQEKRGLDLFRGKANCAACHPGDKDDKGSFPLFTDFSYDVLGIPRNWPLPQTYNDLGLGNSVAVADWSEADRAAVRGAFKVPSLRNVGLRKAFFHNGRFTNLTDVVTFYVQRDTNPEKWYLKADGTPDLKPDGSVNKFNDLDDEADRGNVNVEEVPYNNQPGGTPVLNASEIQDLVSFLCTLTDGWTPSSSASCNR